MYRPAFYDCTEAEEIWKLIARHPFAVLVTAQNGLTATHTPLLRRQDAQGKNELYGHIARWNPQAPILDEATEVLCIFTGSNGYVSPSWYQDEDDVPTWNYSAVHVYGRCHVIEDRLTVRSLLDDTVDHFEKQFESPWNTQMISQSIVSGFQDGVTAFSIEVHRIEAAKKLGQDKSRDDRLRVSEGLEGKNQALGECPIALDMRSELWR